jgi:hypothetical protein
LGVEGRFGSNEANELIVFKQLAIALQIELDGEQRKLVFS